jgi:hypothetical protein
VDFIRIGDHFPEDGIIHHGYLCENLKFHWPYTRIYYFLLTLVQHF